MNEIKTVKVFNSNVNHHNGKDLGAGFAVIIDPHPITEHQIWQVAQAITNALEGLKLEDE